MIEKIWQKSIAVLFCQLVFVLAFCGAPAFAQDSAKADTLLTKISSSYEKSHGAWQVMSLHACGMGGTADKETLLSETLSAVANGTTDATLLQRNIIALTAAGYDCTELPQGNDKADAVSVMAAKVGGDALINVKVSTLLAYTSGGYSVPQSALLSEQELIASICSAQLPDGGFAFFGTVSDADMTALAISALQPFAQSSEEAYQAVEKARKALLAKRLADGTWPSGSQASGNANSTAFAVIALCALGVDPRQPSESCAVTPLDALLTFANADNSGFLYAGKANALATEQGFRALVACKGFAAAQGAYNIYTQASKATAVFEPVEAEEPAASEPAKGPKDNKESGSKKKTKKSAKKSSSSGKASSASASGSGSSAGSSSSSYYEDDDDNFDDSGEDSDVNSEEFEVDGEEVTDSEPEAFEEDEAELNTTSEKPAEGTSNNKLAMALVGSGALLLAVAAALYFYWSRRRRGER